MFNEKIETWVVVGQGRWAKVYLDEFFNISPKNLLLTLVVNNIEEAENTHWIKNYKVLVGYLYLKKSQD